MLLHIVETVYLVVQAVTLLHIVETVYLVV